MKNAIVLCSGGLDSVTVAYYAIKKMNYGKIIILFIDYGQKTLIQERKAAMHCANELKSEFRELHLSGLIEVSKKKGIEKNDLRDTSEESRQWYVPCRNQIFLSYAMAFAEYLAMKDGTDYEIIVGFKCEGNEPYPDTTQSFLDKMNEISKTLYTKPKIIAPFINMDKEDIILLGRDLGIDYSKTFSCYVGEARHCGQCLSCRLRKAGFKWANVNDPTEYESSKL